MLKRHANACDIDLYFKLLVLMWSFVSDSRRKTNLESPSSFSFCFSKNCQRTDTLFSLQLLLRYEVSWGSKILTALWKILSAQCCFGWEVQGLLPGISNKLSVSLSSVPADTEQTQVVLELCHCVPSVVWGWGLGGICFVFLNWTIKFCHSLLTSHNRFQHGSTVSMVPLYV